MAAFWPYSDSPLAPAMNDIPKVNFSRSGIKDGTLVDRTPGVTPKAAVLQSWAEPTVARGDLAEEVLRLKEQPGNLILAQGGARFAQSLVASGLIDEYRMVAHPVVLGRGQPLFSGLRSPVDLRLISATPFSSGVVAAVYQPA
jgi:dihydrofolate reductase